VPACGRGRTLKRSHRPGGFSDGALAPGGARRNKPAALRALAGSKVRPHHRERAEPTFRVVALGTPPDTLGGVGTAYWAYYGDLLERPRVLTEGDRDALFDFCFAEQRMWLTGVLRQVRGFRPPRGSWLGALRLMRRVAACTGRLWMRV
jgi:hypothetical protein